LSVDRGVLDGSLSIDSIKFGFGLRIQQLFLGSNWWRILFLDTNIQTIKPRTWLLIKVNRLAGVIVHLYIITWLLLLNVDRGVLDGSLSINSIKFGFGL